VHDERGEVVAEGVQQPGLAGERFDVCGGLRDDEDLAVVRAAALQQRERLVGARADDSAELVER
jgi:hypothetical protein